MPFYEYKCTVCDSEQLVFHLMSDDMTGADCDHCGEPSLERLFSTLQKIASIDSTVHSRVRDFIESSKGALSHERDSLKGREKE